ncbi:MAG: hypothetical protein QME57_01605, partial [Patescibacteria group bacterium]|nr:hypothetical protein [Patescibacteria group bacterium]
MDNQNQSKLSNKGISTPIGILIIICVLLTGGILAWQLEWFKKEVKMPEVKMPEVEIEEEV